MGKSKVAFSQGFQYGWNLFWSPFVGAYKEMKGAISRPGYGWRQFFIYGVLLGLSPVKGAVAGFLSALREPTK